MSHSARRTMAAPKRIWTKPLVEQLSLAEASLRLLKARRVPGPMVEHIDRLARCAPGTD